jgi:hypothetical protein
MTEDRRKKLAAGRVGRTAAAGMGRSVALRLNPEAPIPQRWTVNLALGGVSPLLALGVIGWGLRTSFPVRGMIYELNDPPLSAHPGLEKLASPIGQLLLRALIRINAAGSIPTPGTKHTSRYGLIS